MNNSCGGFVSYYSSFWQQCAFKNKPCIAVPRKTTLIPNNITVLEIDSSLFSVKGAELRDDSIDFLHATRLRVFNRAFNDICLE